MYYDYQKILSYNAMINILIGERGVGKSFGITKHVINRFLKHKERFAYIRRYKTELKKAKPKFFDAIIANGLFGDVEFEVKGDQFYINDNVAGYAMSLSTAQDLKSSNFVDVKWIIFDEFVIEKGQKHYIQNEVINFLGIVESLARMNEARAFLLGNSADITCPYFLFWDLHLPYNSDINVYKDGLILYQQMVNLQYREKKRKTKFGKLIEGTEYANYAIDNKFLGNNDYFIKKKTGNSSFRFAFTYKEQIYGVWFDYKNSLIFVSNNIAQPVATLFSFTLENHNPNTLLIKSARTYPIIKIFIDQYRLGNVRFESHKIKSVTYDVIKLLLT